MAGLIFQSGLFLWFLFSLYLVAIDTTLSLKIKIIGEMINVLCLGYIGANATGNNQSLTFFLIGIGLLGWFFYYTPHDILNTGYTLLEKSIYVTVDICMILFLSMSLWFAFCPINTNSLGATVQTPRSYFLKIFSSVM